MFKVKVSTLFLITIAVLLLAACGYEGYGDTGYSGNPNLAEAPGVSEPDNQDKPTNEPDLTDESDRMANQGRSLEILDKIHAEFPTDSRGQHVYPNYLGGVYLDDNGRLTIMMVESGSPEAWKFLSGLDGWVLVRDTVFSHQELTDLMNWLNEKSDKVAEFASGWGLDTIGNRVYIQMIRYTDEEIARFRSEVIDSPMITLCDPRATAGIESGDNISSPLQINPELDSLVAMTVTDVTETTVTIAIHNNSALPLTTGYEHILEYYSADEWRYIPSVFAVNALGLPVNPGESFEMTVDLQEYLHIIEPGLFRIRKSVMIDTWQTGDMIDGRPSIYPVDTLHEVVAEFHWG